MGNGPSEKPVKVYKKSEVIFQQDASGDEMYFIRSGKVKLILGATEQGAEVGILEPGEYFGEMALIDTSPRSATAIAVEENTELEVLDREGFLQMIREFPEFALDLMRGLCQRVRQANILYVGVIKEALSPYCPRNCLAKTLDAFAREAMSQASRMLEGPPRETARMDNWKCTACDYIYIPRFGDPQRGVLPGTPFEKLSGSWICPVCGAAIAAFQKIAL